VTGLRTRMGSEPHDAVADAGDDPRVLQALGQLSAADRELLLLVAWEGLEPAELAQALDARPGTIAVRLHRARRRFAAALGALDQHVNAPRLKAHR
jgi:RNA polymerase sigma-70 factor, ECF subfamily